VGLANGQVTLCERERDETFRHNQFAAKEQG